MGEKLGAVLYDSIPVVLLRIFSATDEMLAIGGVPYHRNYLDYFRHNDYDKWCAPSDELRRQGVGNQHRAGVSLVGSAALLSPAGSMTPVWFAFPVSEIIELSGGARESP